LVAAEFETTGKGAVGERLIEVGAKGFNIGNGVVDA
jgi:hypothetical protein